MSGRKYSTVTVRSNWDAQGYANRQAENARRAAERHADALMRQARDEAEARARRFDKTVKDLRQEQRHMFDGVHQQINQMQTGFNTSLAQTRAKLNEGLKAVREDFSHAMAEQENRLSQALYEQGKALNDRLGLIEKSAATTEQFARDVLEATQKELQHIADAYLHNLFCPGEVNAIEQRLQIVRENLNAQRGTAALPLAQESLLQTQQLHARLEVFQQQWETLRIAALAALDAALACISAEQEFSLALDQQTLAALPPMPPLSTDYWSNGQLLALKKEMEARRTRINDPQSPVPLSELQRDLSEGEDALQKLAGIIQHAHDTALASIQRADMQMEFYEKLQASGYKLEDNAWAANDERLANHMVMKGLNGDRLAIVIRPEAQGAAGISNRIEINFEEPAPSEIRRREKLDQLTQVLSSVYDIPAAFAPMPGEEWTKNAPAECFDLTRVRQG